MIIIIARDPVWKTYFLYHSFIFVWIMTKNEVVDKNHLTRLVFLSGWTISFYQDFSILINIFCWPKKPCIKTPCLFFFICLDLSRSANHFYYPMLVFLTRYVCLLCLICVKNYFLLQVASTSILRHQRWSENLLMKNWLVYACFWRFKNYLNEYGKCSVSNLKIPRKNVL